MNRAEYHHDWYLKHRDNQLQKYKDYYQQNKETIETYKRQWVLENRQRVIEVRRKWYQKNRQKIIEYMRNWKANHPESVKAYYHTEAYKEYLKKHRTELLARWKTKDLPKGNSCTICGSDDRLEKHHPDYDKPLDFVTLCKDCHEILHM